MDLGIRIRAVGRRHRDLLSAMYDGFDPLGAALGLPPPASETRRSWIGRALGQKWNLAAFSREGRIVGHCFLAADDPASAELAIFVHQESRGRGNRSGVGESRAELGSCGGRPPRLERYSLRQQDRDAFTEAPRIPCHATVRRDRDGDLSAGTRGHFALRRVPMNWSYDRKENYDQTNYGRCSQSPPDSICLTGPVRRSRGLRARRQCFFRRLDP